MSDVRRSDAASSILNTLLKDGFSAAGQLLPAVKLDAEARKGYQDRLTAAKRCGRWQKTPDHYRLLGVQKTAPEEDIRRYLQSGGQAWWQQLNHDLLH